MEGYELDPMVRQPWQPPYYRERIEEAGFGKAIDLLMWHLMVDDRDKVLPVIFEMAEKLEPEHGITIRKMSRRRLRKDLDDFAEVYNAAWADNWGFVPYSKKDLDAYWAELQLVFDPNWFMVAASRTTVVRYRHTKYWSTSDACLARADDGWTEGEPHNE
jgi:hypothetical protein